MLRVSQMRHKPTAWPAASTCISWGWAAGKWNGISVMKKVKLFDVSWAVRSRDLNLGALCLLPRIVAGKLTPSENVCNMEFLYFLELSMDLIQNETDIYGSVSAFICSLVCSLDCTCKWNHTVLVFLCLMYLSTTELSRSTHIVINGKKQQQKAATDPLQTKQNRKPKLLFTGGEWRGKRGKLGKGEWKVQALSSGISKSWGWRTQQRGYGQWYCMVPDRSDACDGEPFMQMDVRRKPAATPVWNNLDFFVPALCFSYFGTRVIMLGFIKWFWMFSHHSTVCRILMKIVIIIIFFNVW